MFQQQVTKPARRIAAYLRGSKTDDGGRSVPAAVVDRCWSPCSLRPPKARSGSTCDWWLVWTTQPAVVEFRLLAYNVTLTGHHDQLHPVGEIHHVVGARWAV